MSSWWLPDEDNVKITFADFDLAFGTSLKADDNGHLQPVSTGVDVTFGNTSFQHDNWFVNIFVWPIAKLSIQILDVMPSFISDFFFSGMVAPFVDGYIGAYYTLPLALNSPLSG